MAGVANRLPPFPGWSAKFAFWKRKRRPRWIGRRHGCWRRLRGWNVGGGRRWGWIWCCRSCHVSTLWKNENLLNLKNLGNVPGLRWYHFSRRTSPGILPYCICSWLLIHGSSGVISNQEHFQWELKWGSSIGDTSLIRDIFEHVSLIYRVKYFFIHVEPISNTSQTVCKHVFRTNLSCHLFIWDGSQCYNLRWN